MKIMESIGAYVPILLPALFQVTYILLVELLPRNLYLVVRLEESVQAIFLEGFIGLNGVLLEAMRLSMRFRRLKGISSSGYCRFV